MIHHVFWDVIDVMSFATSTDQKCDIFEDLVLEQPYDRFSDLEELSDILIHGRRYEQEGNKSFRFLFDRMKYLLLSTHNIEDLHYMDVSVPTSMTMEEKDFVRRMRYLDALVVLPPLY